MKDEEEYQDYLVDKAKEILNDELSDASKGKKDVPDPKKKRDTDGKVEDEARSEIPVAWDPRETGFLKQNRKKMSNEEMKAFLEKESDFHDEIEDMDEWNGFSRWEERLILQNYKARDVESIADELDREAKEVKIKMRMMGIPSIEDLK